MFTFHSVWIVAMMRTFSPCIFFRFFYFIISFFVLFCVCVSENCVLLCGIQFYHSFHSIGFGFSRLSAVTVSAWGTENENLLPHKMHMVAMMKRITRLARIKQQQQSTRRKTDKNGNNKLDFGEKVGDGECEFWIDVCNLERICGGFRWCGMSDGNL